MTKGFFALSPIYHHRIFAYLSSEELYRFCKHPQNDERLRRLAWQALHIRRQHDPNASIYQIKLIQSLASSPTQRLFIEENWLETLKQFLKELTPPQLKKRIAPSELSLTTLNRLSCLIILKKTAPFMLTKSLKKEILENDQSWWSVSDCSDLIYAFLQREQIELPNATYRKFNELRILSVLQPPLLDTQKDDLGEILIKKFHEESVSNDYFDDFSMLSLYLNEHHLIHTIPLILNVIRRAPKALMCLETLSYRLSAGQINLLVQKHFENLDNLNNLENQYLNLPSKQKEVGARFAYCIAFASTCDQKYRFDLVRLLMKWINTCLNSISEETFKRMKDNTSNEHYAFSLFKKLTSLLNNSNSNGLALLILQSLAVNHLRMQMEPIDQHDSKNQQTLHNEDKDPSVFVVSCHFIVLLSPQLDRSIRNHCIQVLLQAVDNWRLTSTNQPHSQYWLVMLSIIDALPALVPFMKAAQQLDVILFLLNAVESFKIMSARSQKLLHVATLNCLGTLAPRLAHIPNTEELEYLPTSLKTKALKEKTLRDRILKYIQGHLNSPVESAQTDEVLTFPDHPLFQSIPVAALYCQTAFCYGLSADELHHFYRNQLYVFLFSKSGSLTIAAFECFKTLKPFSNKKERLFLLEALTHAMSTRDCEWLGTFMDGIPLLMRSCKPPEVIALTQIILKMMGELSNPSSDLLATNNNENSLVRESLSAAIVTGLHCLIHLPDNFYTTQYLPYAEITHHIIEHGSQWTNGWIRSYGYEYLASRVSHLTQDELHTLFTQLIVAFPHENSIQTTRQCLLCLIQCQRKTNDSRQLEALFHLLLPMLSEDSPYQDSRIETADTPNRRLIALEGFLPLIPYLDKEQLSDSANILLARLYHSTEAIRSIALECISQLVLYLDYKEREKIRKELTSLCKKNTFSLEAYTARTYLRIYNSIPAFNPSPIFTPSKEIQQHSAPSQKQTDSPSPSPWF